jgi:N-terminal half of MaoC dehydratase
MSFVLTDEMRAAIGVEGTPWPVEFTSTGIRSFARGVGYTDPVYFDVAAAQAAGYPNLPAPPTYGGIPVFSPGRSDDRYGTPPSSGQPAVRHGLKNLLDGGTEHHYVRVPVAGETLFVTSKLVDLEVKESKSIGQMLVITNESTYKDADGNTVFTTRGQAIFY